MSDSQAKDSTYRRYVCRICGYIYDEAKGDPDSGLAPGTRFEAIPDDWQCPWCGVAKMDLEPVPVAPSQPTVAVATTARSAPALRLGRQRSAEGVVIIGGGIAGWRAAEALRQQAPTLPVTLLTACDGALYPKPRLSAAYSQGATPDELIEASGPQRAAELGIELYPQTRIRRLDLQRRRVITACGGFAYRYLVLALGAHPRPMTLLGNGTDQLLSVNHLDDYRRLRQRLDQQDGAKHIALLGAGLVGSEFAEDLTQGGHHVHLVDPADRPLANLLPPALSHTLAKQFQAKGMTCHWQRSAHSLDLAANDQLALTLDQGETLHVDAVLSATGLVPHTTLASEAGLVIRQGIVVDTHLQTTGMDVYALGDCAEIEGVIYSYIDPITRQAQALAEAIAQRAGMAVEPQPFDTRPVPVVIKTPSLPLVVCPPPPHASGQWHALDDGWAFYDTHRRLLGFALANAATSQAEQWRQNLAEPLPPQQTVSRAVS